MCYFFLNAKTFNYHIWWKKYKFLNVYVDSLHIEICGLHIHYLLNIFKTGENEQNFFILWIQQLKGIKILKKSVYHIFWCINWMLFINPEIMYFGYILCINWYIYSLLKQTTLFFDKIKLLRGKLKKKNAKKKAKTAMMKRDHVIISLQSYWRFGFIYTRSR